MNSQPLRILISTNMYPHAVGPWYGIFVQEQVEALRELGAQVDVCVQYGNLSRWNYARGIFELARRLRTGNYDLIHSHHTYSTLVAWLAKLITGLHTPIVMTFHDSEIFRRGAYGGQQDAIERLKYNLAVKTFALRRCAYLIPVQREMLARVFGERVASAPPSRVIPMGVDLARFAGIEHTAARRELGLPNDRPVVFFPSAAGKPEKRHDLALAAIELLRAEGMDLHFHAAGNIPYAQMPLHLAAADAVIIPSDYEASPMVVRESLACETPIVATPVGDVSEYAHLPGVFVCDWSPAALADGLRRALRAPRPYGGLALNRERALDRLDVARRVLAVYRQVLARTV